MLNSTRPTLFMRLAHFLRQLLQGEQHTVPNRQASALKIIPRTQHTISRNAIDRNALKVLYRLHKAGYQAYLVGGGIRDLLLGRQPKDFDITTNATPDQVRVLFRNCRLIGRRFRLAHILFGRQVVEVATFRGHHHPQADSTLDQTAQGRLLRDNVYGSIEEDAQRRDFTINSLYYSIADFSLRDYANGLNDLQQKIIRLIGDAESRYREDPVRMLRAIRFSAKLNMSMSEDTAAPIARLAPLLHEIPAARLFEESLKLLQSGYGLRTYILLRDYQLFQYLFPLVAQGLSAQRQILLEKMVQRALQNCDERIATGKSVNPAFLLAALLWYPLLTLAEQDAASGGAIPYAAFMLAVSQVLQQQCRTLAIPRRLTNTMRDIWQLQLRLPRYQGSRAQRLLAHPKFRAAYDLLQLRAEIEGGELAKLETWWCRFQQQNPIVEKERVRMGGRPNKLGKKSTQ